jgi:hypothetical protein
MYVYLAYRTIRTARAAAVAVVATKEMIDFQHKNIKGCLKTRMCSIFG